MRNVLLSLILLNFVTPASAQAISLFGSGYAQSFDTLRSTTGGSPYTWENNNTLTGWYAFRQTGALDSYTVNNGSSGTGSLDSFGVNNNSERALGSIAVSGVTDNIVFGAIFRNVSGVTLPISLSYLGEQWRANSTTAQSLTFSYQVSATAITSSAGWAASTALPVGWTSVSALAFTSPTNTTVGQINGDSAANQVILAATFLTNLPNNSFLEIRWFDLADSASLNHGLAIESLVLSVPEQTTNVLIVMMVITYCAVTYWWKHSQGNPTAALLEGAASEPLATSTQVSELISETETVKTTAVQTRELPC